jgi:hypothetical protein
MWNLQKTKVALGQVSLPELLLSHTHIIRTNPHLTTYSKKDKRAKQYTFGNTVTLDRPVLAVTSKFWAPEGCNAVKFHTEGGPTRCMVLYSRAYNNYAKHIRRYNTEFCAPVYHPVTWLDRYPTRLAITRVFHVKVTLSGMIMEKGRSRL